ncbi:hypothetical protein FPV67DRAFT_647266 [Lyophyllum atratum]|nr:hypothetical protein FPV67DRAFT_647266 [Lyophyllum atratum]
MPTLCLPSVFTPPASLLSGMNEPTPFAADRLGGADSDDENKLSLPLAPPRQHTTNAPIADSSIVEADYLPSPPVSQREPTAEQPLSPHTSPQGTTPNLVIIANTYDEGDATDTDDGGYLNGDGGNGSDDGYDYDDMDGEHDMDVGYPNGDGGNGSDDGYDLEGGHEWDDGDDSGGGYHPDMDNSGGCCDGSGCWGCDLNAFISRLQRGR